MEKQNLMAKIYGYLVCLVTIITFLIAITTFINAVLDYTDPLHAGNSYNQPSLASFDNYKMDVLKTHQKEGESTQNSFIPDDKTLHNMYEAAKTDKISSEKFHSKRTMVVDSILIIVCIFLFSIHWGWMRRLAKKEA
jgi:hypothetical protein